ncbi:DUF5719 family protein [Sinomonas mesophila]|uniref:DUF5719 family protein n=1 Tax=Sinomonas mesophila TaxID=1531955 RepID=UPI0009873A78|nr:DUF5719 family protein [Sinomonas mesophila]
MKPASEGTARKRRRVRAAVSSAVGTLLVAAGAGLAVAGSALPAPSSLSPGAPRAAEVPAGNTVRTCPGPARLLEGTPVAGDAQFSPVSTTAESSLSAVIPSSATGAIPPGTLETPDGDVLRTVDENLADTGGGSLPRASVIPREAVDAPTALDVDAEGGRASSAAALFRFSAGDGDLRGLATASCTPPSNDQWLVGASTLVGRTSVLTLTNTSGTPSTVDLEFFGDARLEQAPPGSRGLQVAPGSSKSVALAGYLPGQSSLSVHVRSRGGPVAASVQQSTLRGLTPGGVEFITPAVAPATRQTVTGIELQDPDRARELASRRGFADAGASVQLTVPGAVDAVVQLRVYGRNGPVALPGGGVVTAKAGAVTTVSLAGLPAGTYSVSAAADVSFTAGAHVPRGLDAAEPLDFAAPGASVRLGDTHVLPVGSLGSRSIVLGVPEGRAQIRAVPVTEDGRQHPAVTIDVAGGTTAVLDAADSLDGSPVAGYIVSASGDPAFGSLLTRGDGNQIAGAAFVGPVAGSQSLPVTLGH